MTGRRGSWTRIKIIQTIVGLGVTLVAALPVHNLAAQVARPVVEAEISHLAETAHLEFKGLKNWQYDLTRNPATNSVVIAIPPIDAVSVTRLQGFSDGLVKSITVDKKGPDNTYLISFNLTQADIESFDYLTDDPSRLIVDFYQKVDPAKEDAPVKTVPTEKKVAKAKKTVAAVGPNGYKKSPSPSRRPAGDEFLSVSASEKEEDVSTKFGIFDSGDDNYDRFRIKDYEIKEDAIIASRQNIYLPFPILKLQVNFLDKLMKDKPEYVIHPKNTRENKEARLLLTLAERKRYAVFLKTYDYFINRYPESEYTEILKSIKANVHLTRWKENGNSQEFEQASKLYSELVQKFAESPLREYNNLVLGFSLMERGDALATLQTFEAFLKTYPESEHVPVVRSAVAEGYLILRKYDEATAEYNKIISSFPKTPAAYEARYRLGDVPFQMGDYNKAIQVYESAIKDLPSQEKVYPNADYNLAESKFMQKEYKSALESYIRFINLYPTHDHGGFALTRVGELLGILGADPRRVMGAFLESYFRFPNHPGAKVARIRMFAQQMKGMKVKELKRAVAEIEKYSESVPLADIKEFTTLMMAEGLGLRGEYKLAISNLIAYFQKNPSSANLNRFKGRILRNIADELKSSIDKGDFLAALQFHSQYSTNWLANSDRIDIPYFVGQAYESAGAYANAEEVYKKTLGERKAIAGTDLEKEKKVSEHLPSIFSLNLRLAAMTEQTRHYLDSYNYLRAITSNEDLSPAEVVERVQLSAQIAEHRNDHEKARNSLVELAKKWEGDPALLAPVNLKLAQTFLKLGEYQKAEEYATKVLSAEGGDTQINEKTIVDAMLAKSDALFKQKKSLAAVESYQKVLERFESKMPLGSTRYKVGQILFDRGDLMGAAEVWKPLEGSKNSLLWKLGKEKLDQYDWQEDYTKYINRIPAMTSKGKKEINR